MPRAPTSNIVGLPTSLGATFVTLAYLILLVVAVLGATGVTFALTALLLRSRTPSLQGGSPNDLRLLQNEVQRLGDELDRAQSELGRLQERMDFTERLLESGDDGRP